MEKDKKKKPEAFIEVIQGETKSEEAKKSMELILAKLSSAKNAEKKGKKYADLL